MVAEREVLFTLRPQVSSDAQSIFDKFGSAAERAAQRQAAAFRSAADAGLAASVKAEQSRVSAAEKAAAARVKAEEKAASAAEREAEKREKAEIARELRIFKAKQKAIDDRMKAEEKAAEAERRIHERAEKERQSAIKKSERTYESAAEKVRSSNRAVADSFHMAGEGVVKIGEGFAKLGLAGEEDIEKLVQGLVRLKGSVDLIRGGVEIYRGITDGIRAYRTAVEAATVANKALAASQALTAGAGAAGSVASGAAGGVARNTAAGVAAGAAGGVGARALPAAAAAGGPAATVAAGAAAVASVGLVLYELYEMFSGTAKHADSLTYKIAETEVAVVNWFGTVTGLFDLVGDKATTEAEKKLAAERKFAADRVQAIRGESAGVARFVDAQRGMDVAGIDRKIADRGLTGVEAEAERARLLHGRDVAALGAASKQTAGLRDEYSKAQSSSDSRISNMEELRAKIAAAEDRQSAAEQHAIQSAQARIAAEEKITQEKIRGADALIARGQQEISMRQAAIEAERQARMSVSERIAAMDEKQQAAFVSQVEAIRSKQVAGQTFSAAEYQFAQQWSDVRGIRGIKDSQTGRRAGGVIDRLGLFAESDAEIANIRAGRTGDKDREFAGRGMEEIRARIQQQTEVKVTLEMDHQKLVNEISRQILNQQEEGYRRVMDAVRREIRNVDDKVSDLTVSINGREASGRASTGG